MIVAKTWFSRRMQMKGEEVGSTTLGIEAMHHWSDAITSGAAFVGISIALWGGAGWETADDWAALFGCVIIAFNGFSMFTKALGDVMDTAAPRNFENEVRALALAVPGVRALDKNGKFLAIRVNTTANLGAGLVSKGAAINTQSPDLGNLFNDLSVSRQLKFDIGTLDIKGGWFHSTQNVKQRWSISERVMEAGRNGALIDLYDTSGAALTSAAANILRANDLIQLDTDGGSRAMSAKLTLKFL